MNVLLFRLIPSWCSGCRITLVLTFGFGGIGEGSSHLLGEESPKYRIHRGVLRLFRWYFQTYVLPNWMRREPTVCPLSFADGLLIASGPTHGYSTEHRRRSHWAVFAPLSVRSRRDLRKRTQMIRDARLWLEQLPWKCTKRTNIDSWAEKKNVGKPDEPKDTQGRTSARHYLPYSMIPWARHDSLLGFFCYQWC